MRVKIGPYRSWFGPYQLADAICFWAKGEDGIDKPEWVHSFGEWLAYGKTQPSLAVGDVRPLNSELPKTWLYRLLLWLDSFKSRKLDVHIDRWDSWSADDTLAHIILPLLKQLRECKQGAPLVDDDDVPNHLRSTAAPPKEHEWDTDEHHFARWDWVLDEMIWAFEQKVNDNWEDAFFSGESDYYFEKQQDGNYVLKHGDNHTAEIDWEGRKAHQARMSRGFQLFGKYYESLWS